ncbi:glycosyltransferase family 2 protein [Nitrincola tapanii]|uniref:Glycosyltransferase n=1 Tax=Nitrincola tapanii TaxID=1708751 RepID=A0A5A9W1C0_9GAMM|nr:glycosyltransferase family 2 protein [Nitrincola tapanii]KAA0874353.1 glycosyltransferase [Nitrincola tapanii]
MSEIRSQALNALLKPRELERPPRITCILPAYNEAENLQQMVPLLCEVLPNLSSDFEILVVDDGSRDATAGVVVAMSDLYPVSLLALSRNFGKEAAMSAGLDHAEGDLVILMDSDMQHPVEMLEVFYQHWLEGYDMVYGIRADRSDEHPLKRRLTHLFYQALSRSAEVEIQANAGDFRLMDARVVKALRALPERKRMMKGLFAWVGFRSIGVPFKVNPRFSGATSFGLRRLSSLALTGITAFSSAPLRIWMIIGIIISLLAMGYALLVVLSTLLLGSDVPGWPTLVAGIGFLGGMQLLSVGILGEYISRIFAEVKGRPVYLVSDYIRSSKTPSAQSEMTAPAAIPVQDAD